MATVQEVLGPQSVSLLEELKAASNHMRAMGRGALPVRPSDETAPSAASLIATPGDPEPQIPS